MAGWVKLYRALIKKPIWLNSTPEHKSILVTMLLLANHEKSEWEWMGEKFSVVPGQFVTSLESIRKKTGKGISIQNVRSCLKRLQKLQFATSEATRAGRLITIINWDSYQPEEKKATKIATDDQQRSNKGATPNKNERTKEQQEQIKDMCDFDNFWALYDKKVDRKKCLSKFNKLKQSDIDSIFKNLPAYVASTPDPSYRKNPGTYLNNESWNDQIIPKGKLNGKAKNYTGPDTREPVIPDRMPKY